MVRPTPEANRVNVAKFYDSNKDDIQKRAVLKRIEDGKSVRQATLDKYNIESPKKQPAKRGGYTITQLGIAYQKRVDDPNIQMSQRTADDYIRNMKRILLDTGCNPEVDLIECLNKSKVLNFILEHYPKPSTRKTYIQVFLYAIDNIPKLNENVKNRDKYYNEWETAKDGATERQIQKQVEGEVVRFSEIKKRIEKEFAKNSQEVLLINLYDELTMRNDFGDIIIFDKTPPKSKQDNYITLSTGRLIINNFNKTGNKYKPVNMKLSTRLMKKIRKSLKQDPRGMLFDDTAKLFKNMKTGVNEIRHAKISEELEGDKIKDPEKRKELYDKMKHSASTQLNYIRKII